MKRCVTTSHFDVLENSQGVLLKHTLFKSIHFQILKILHMLPENFMAESDLSHKLRCYRGISGPEKSRNNTREKISYFFTCWYSQSAADSSLAFGVTRSGWWMKGKAFTILNTSCLSELSRIRAAKTLKNPYRWQTMRFKLLEGEKNQYTKRKTENYVFGGFGVGISLGWEWKSTNGRFATGRFWPFTWKTSSVGKNKVNEWEFCKLEITTIVVFVILIRRIFPS